MTVQSSLHFVVFAMPVYNATHSIPREVEVSHGLSGESQTLSEHNKTKNKEIRINRNP